LKSMHEDPIVGHFGEKATTYRIKKQFYWPLIKNNIKSFVKGCNIYQRREKPRAHKPLNPAIVGQPFECISIDFVGPLPLTKQENKYLIVATEYLTKHGCSHELITDHGSPFDNGLINTICKRLGIKHIISSPYHSQANKLVKRYNQTLCKTIAKCMSQYGDEWDKYVSSVLFAYRTTRHSITQKEPFYLTYGREVTLPAELFILSYPSEPIRADQVPQLLINRTLKIIDKLQKACVEACQNIKQSQIKQKHKHDSHYQLHSFKIGDKVLLYKTKLDTHRSGKLEENGKILGFQKVNMPNSSSIEKRLESIQPNLQQLIRKLKDGEELIIRPNQVILKIGEQEYIKEISGEKRRTPTQRIHDNLALYLNDLKQKEEIKILITSPVIGNNWEEKLTYLCNILKKLYFQIGELLAEKGWYNTTSKLSVHFLDSKGKLVGRIAKRVYLLFNARGQSNIQSIQAINILVLEHIAEKDFESLLVEAK
ncbi:33539_t:CDS:2, partial [Gigaspora margarita]